LNEIERLKQEKEEKVKSFSVEIESLKLEKYFTKKCLI
jgi:hypothetical protein